MANCAIVGINWGDEGKGRMVDLLTEDYDIVVRYQGGGNAGHTETGNDEDFNHAQTQSQKSKNDDDGHVVSNLGMLFWLSRFS